MSEGQEDLRCIECGKTFVQRGNLVTHTRRVHLKIRPFECDLCEGRKFAAKKDLEIHIYTVHASQGTEVCHMRQSFQPEGKPEAAREKVSRRQCAMNSCYFSQSDGLTGSKAEHYKITIIPILRKDQDQ